MNRKYVPIDMIKTLIMRDNVIAEEERDSLKLNRNVLIPTKNNTIPKKDNIFSTIKLY